MKEKMEARVQQADTEELIESGCGSYKQLMKLNEEREKIKSEVFEKEERISRIRSVL